MTNLELITGEKGVKIKKPSISQKYEVRFKSGAKMIVREEIKLALDDALDKFWASGKDAMVKFRDGTRASISQITEIRAIRENASDITARLNSEKITKILNEKYSNSRSERIKKWCEKIMDNLIRLKEGESWQYYDRHGNPCSKEQAKLSVVGN